MEYIRYLFYVCNYNAVKQPLEEKIKNLLRSETEANKLEPEVPEPEILPVVNYPFERNFAIVPKLKRSAQLLFGRSPGRAPKREFL